MSRSSVAQLVEQVTVNHLVGGSSPSRGATITIQKNINKLFETLFPNQKKEIITLIGTGIEYSVLNKHIQAHVKDGIASFWRISKEHNQRRAKKH